MLPSACSPALSAHFWPCDYLWPAFTRTSCSLVGEAVKWLNLRTEVQCLRNKEMLQVKGRADRGRVWGWSRFRSEKPEPGKLWGGRGGRPTLSEITAFETKAKPASDRKPLIPSSVTTVTGTGGYLPPQICKPTACSHCHINRPDSRFYAALQSAF